MLHELKGLSVAEQLDLVPEGTILLGYRGSIAHGMYLHPDHPNSVDDKDLLGVAIGPLESYLGLSHFEQHERQLREWDVVVYEARKFIHLLEKANPNVLSLLWLEPHFYIVRTPWGETLLHRRDLFVSKQVYPAFVGYAHGQFKRMTHHAQFGYMGAKRKALVEQYGFDTKNAAHLIRILRMGIEFLVDGELHVFRHDASQLIEIKTGQWTLEQVKQEAAHLFKRAEAAYDASKLPLRADHKKISQLCLHLLWGYFKGEHWKAGRAPVPW